jgi:hypothetical protein
MISNPLSIELSFNSSLSSFGSLGKFSIDFKFVELNDKN